MKLRIPLEYVLGKVLTAHLEYDVSRMSEEDFNRFIELMKNPDKTEDEIDELQTRQAEIFSDSLVVPDRCKIMEIGPEIWSIASIVE